MRGAPGFDGNDEIDFAVGSVTGVRVWKMDTANCGLEGQNGFRWADGENAAECSYGCQSTPGEACGCGFWAYWDLGAALVFKPAEWAVAGVVEGYGRTMIGDRGFRSARARIVALCLMFDIYTKPETGDDGFYDVLDQQRHPDELALKAEIEHALSLAYPSVQIRTSAKTMLAIHPTTKDYLPEREPEAEALHDSGFRNWLGGAGPSAPLTVGRRPSFPANWPGRVINC